jgi:hypothetical protein
MEIQLILASIVQRFDFALDPAQRVVLDPQITLGPKHGMHLRLFERDSGFRTRDSEVGDQEIGRREVEVAAGA